MTPDKIFVTILGFAAIAFIVWFFWMSKKTGTRVAVASSGYQEALVLVKGGYTPDVIVVERGKPMRFRDRLGGGIVECAASSRARGTLSFSADCAANCFIGESPHRAERARC